MSDKHDPLFVSEDRKLALESMLEDFSEKIGITNDG
jgi:hypothetical protein